jgi:hypothetical protein
VPPDLLWVRGPRAKEFQVTAQRISIFPLRPGADRAELERIAVKFADILASQPGHHSTCLDITDGGSQLRSVSVWSSAAEAERITAVARDAAVEELGALLSGPPQTTIGQVLDAARR